METMILVCRIVRVLLMLSISAACSGGDGSSAVGVASEGLLRTPAAMAVAQEDGVAAVQEVETGVSFARSPFVHPHVIETFVAWSDVHVVGIDLLDAERVEFPQERTEEWDRYSGEIYIREIEGACPVVSWLRPHENRYGAGAFSYDYVGMTDSGVHVLFTSDWGGGSGVFQSLLFLILESSSGIVPNRDWDDLDDGGMESGSHRLWDAVVRPATDRIVARKLGEITLGDRWDGNLRVRANDVFVGQDQGWFVGSGGTGGINNWRADRWLTLDFSPVAPLGFAAHRGTCADRQ